MNLNFKERILCVLIALAACSRATAAQDQPVRLAVRWDTVIRTSQTTATLQVVVNPPLRRGTPVHDGAFKTLHDIGADYVRYVLWLPYHKLGVAELEPPKDGKTLGGFLGHRSRDHRVSRT